MESIYGSYKISPAVLYKMISAEASYKGRYAGASRYEILALLYLSRISDASGFVEDFRTSEFIRGIGCSRREAFSLIHSLENKGYVSFSSSDWKCCRGIRILNNDFSHYDKTKKYLNTNHDFLVPGGVGYDLFVRLSLTSMRLVLYLMYNYSLNYGYHASYASIQAAVGVRNKRVINSCLNEISPLFALDGDFYGVREDIKRGLRYGFLDILPRLRSFNPLSGISSGQDSYFKRHMLGIIRSEGCESDGYCNNIENLLSRLFAIFKDSSEKKHKPDSICEALRKRLRLDGAFDELTLYHLNEDLLLI